ncbi:MAG: aspartate aminotransferase family protein [Lachnospiraceae bacterium]|nr:aspartate aminotransferase family protein [Lachnospiraceae bacterium]
MNKEEFIKEVEGKLMHTYNRFPIVFDHGEGMYLYETDGTKYLDFGSGIGVYALGYGNREYNEALKAQIDKLLHTSNLFYNEPALSAAKAVCEATGMDRVFFTNSGAEAVEGAIKVARKYYYNRTGKADSTIIAMDHSFHGRTLGAVSVTGKAAYREPFEPLIGGVKFAEFNDLASVEALFDDTTAAVIMETLQGEGGIFPADPEFIKGVRKLCDEHDALLILDEIQCGMGRSGEMFTYRKYGVTPDVVTIAKALGCGVPVGAFAAKGAAAEALVAGDHGSTYGGNPFVCAAATAVFEQFDKLDLLTHVREVAPYLWEKLEAITEDYPCIINHRGIGLMQGLQFDFAPGEIVKAALKRGLILIAAASNVIRFLPPLIVEKEQIDEMDKLLRESIDEVAGR